MKTFPIPLDQIIILFIIGLFTSCGSVNNHYNYAPNDTNLMSLCEKGDAKLSISTSGYRSDDDIGQKKEFNLQFGYSPIRSLGLHCNYYNIAEKRTPRRFPIGGSQNQQLLEFAIGGYLNKQAGQDLEKKIFAYLDMYTGMGWGSVNNFYETTGTSSLEFRKIFIQTAAHLNIQKKFLISLGFTVTHLDYNEGELLGNIPDDNRTAIKNIQLEDPLLLWSPTFRMQGGTKHAKLFFSIKTIMPFKQKDFDILESTLQFGILIEPDEFFSKKRTSPPKEN